MKNENKMKNENEILKPHNHSGQDQFLTYISNQYFKTFDKNTKTSDKV